MHHDVDLAPILPNAIEDRLQLARYRDVERAGAVVSEIYDCESRPRPYRGLPASLEPIGQIRDQKQEAQTVNAERYPVFRSHAAALQCRLAYSPNAQHCGTLPQPFESATFSWENARVVIKGHSFFEIRIIFS